MPAETVTVDATDGRRPVDVHQLYELLRQEFDVVQTDTRGGVEITLTCQRPFCGRKFRRWQSDVRRGHGKYCSRDCQRQAYIDRQTESDRLLDEAAESFKHIDSLIVSWKMVGCREWPMSRDRAGYGKLHRTRREPFVHREIYKRVYGAIPVGRDVLHRCDNPPCYEPLHLWTGTHVENMADMVAKGRSKRTIGNTKVRREGRAEIVRRYRGGESRVALGREFGLSPSRVWQIAKEASA